MRKTKAQIAKEQQNREKKYNLDIMLKNGVISKDYYNKKIKLITVFGGIHNPKTW